MQESCQRHPECWLYIGFGSCSRATWMMLDDLQENADGWLKCQGVGSGGRDTMRIRNQVEASSRNDSKGWGQGLWRIRRRASAGPRRASMLPCHEGDGLDAEVLQTSVSDKMKGTGETVTVALKTGKSGNGSSEQRREGSSLSECGCLPPSTQDSLRPTRMGQVTRSRQRQSDCAFGESHP